VSLRAADVAAGGGAARRGGLERVHGAVLLFGLAGIFGKLIDQSAALIALGRVVFAVPVLALAAALTRASLRPGSVRDALGLAAPGLLLALHWTTFFEAVRVSSVAVALVSYATFPVFVVFIEAALRRRRIRAWSLAATAAVLIGAWLVVPELDLANAAARGALWGLASAAAFALLTVINERSSASRPGIVVAFWQDAAAGAVLAALAPVLASGAPAITARDVALLAALGIPCTALAHTLYIGGLRTVSSRAAALIASLEPVYGILFALVLLGEVPSARTVAGGAIILAAAAYASLRDERG
jgi:drug/metabolite transporter (DMT)-like permease